MKIREFEVSDISFPEGIEQELKNYIEREPLDFAPESDEEKYWRAAGIIASFGINSSELLKTDLKLFRVYAAMRCLDHMPGGEEVMNLASALSAYGRVDDAVKLLEDLEKKKNEKSYYLYRKMSHDEHPLWMAGTLLDNHKRYKEAINCYERALLENGSNWKLWLNIGTCYHDLKEFEKAIVAYHNVLKYKFSVTLENPILDRLIKDAKAGESLSITVDEWENVYY